MSTTNHQLYAEHLRLRQAITGVGCPDDASTCEVIAHLTRKRNERRRRLLHDAGQFLNGLLPHLKQATGSAQYEAAVDMTDAALGLSFLDPGLRLSAPPSQVDGLTLASIGQSVAPGESLSPMELIARIEAYRVHSETLHMVDAILRGEPLGHVTPMPADVVPEVMDEIVDLVSGHMAALRACADALAVMRSTAAADASDAARRSSAEDDLPHV